MDPHAGWGALPVLPLAYLFDVLFRSQFVFNTLILVGFAKRRGEVRCNIYSDSIMISFLLDVSGSPLPKAMV